MLQTYHPEFLTATILEWKPLLAKDEYKLIVLDSMKWLVENKRCSIHAFVIMPNHIHMLWKIADGRKREDVQGALFSFTGHSFKKSFLNVGGDANISILKQQESELNLYRVNDADRTFPRLTERAGILGKKSNDQRMFYPEFLPAKTGLYSSEPLPAQMGAG